MLHKCCGIKSDEINALDARNITNWNTWNAEFGLKDWSMSFFEFSMISQKFAKQNTIDQAQYLCIPNRGFNFLDKPLNNDKFNYKLFDNSSGALRLFIISARAVLLMSSSRT